jgi:hypothetical protein
MVRELMADNEKLRAVRLLRAKAAELENPMPTVSIELRWLAINIGLIAQLLADHIESTGFYLPDEEAPFVPGANDINVPPTHKMPSRGWGPDHPDYDEMGQ